MSTTMGTNARWTIPPVDEGGDPSLPRRLALRPICPIRQANLDLPSHPGREVLERGDVRFGPGPWTEIHHAEGSDGFGCAGRDERHREIRRDAVLPHLRTRSHRRVRPDVLQDTFGCRVRIACWQGLDSLDVTSAGTAIPLRPTATRRVAVSTFTRAMETPKVRAATHAIRSSDGSRSSPASTRSSSGGVGARCSLSSSKHLRGSR
jgi:hypothetical protein